MSKVTIKTLLPTLDFNNTKFVTSESYEIYGKGEDYTEILNAPFKIKEGFVFEANLGMNSSVATQSLKTIENSMHYIREFVTATQKFTEWKAIDSSSTANNKLVSATEVFAGYDDGGVMERLTIPLLAPLTPTSPISTSAFVSGVGVGENKTVNFAMPVQLPTFNAGDEPTTLKATLRYSQVQAPSIAGLSGTIGTTPSNGEVWDSTATTITTWQEKTEVIPTVGIKEIEVDCAIHPITNPSDKTQVFCRVAIKNPTASPLVIHSVKFECYKPKK